MPNNENDERSAVELSEFEFPFLTGSSSSSALAPFVGDWSAGGGCTTTAVAGCAAEACSRSAARDRCSLVEVRPNPVCVTDARFDAHYLCNDGAFDASDATPEGGEGRVS
jgi:hypothetical protein